MDLYKTLKIKRNASFSTIRDAFRKRSMASHPDRGGDAQEFQAVVLANKILSDPTRKARYDATGEIDAKPDNSRSEDMGVVGQVFNSVFQNAAKVGKSPRQEDMLADIRGQVSAALQMEQNNVAAAEKAVAFFTQVVGRFVLTEGENMLEVMVADKLADALGIVAKTKKAVNLLERTLDYLDGYKFVCEAPQRGNSAVVGLATVFATKIS